MGGPVGPAHHDEAEVPAVGPSPPSCQDARMRLTFDPTVESDDDAFVAALDELEEGVRAFLTSNADELELGPDGIDAVAADARMALQFKYSYGNGRLADWSPSDVREFLVDWCPRKVSVSADLADTIPQGLMVLITFLATSDLLVGGEKRLMRLVKEVERCLGPFYEAMSDPSKFGMAKSIFSSLGVESLDGLDEGDIAGLIEQFNALPEEQRRAITDRGLPGTFDELDEDDDDQGPIELPAVELPDHDVAVASAASSPMVAKLQALAVFCGDGRKLTKAGNLTLADAREAVAVVGTGDQVDPVQAGKVVKTRSAADLPGLHQLVNVGKKAGALRVEHGKLLATKRGATFGADALDALERTVSALLDLGPIESKYGRDDYILAVFDEVADDLAIDLLALTYARQGPVAVHDLGEVLGDELVERLQYASAYWNEERIAEQGATLVDRLADVFADAGVILRRGATDPGSDADARSARGGTIELTPAGVVVLHGLLNQAGFDAPTFEPQFADLTADELVTALLEEDDESLNGLSESAAWRSRRDPEAAVAELVAVATEADSQRSSVAFLLLRDIGWDIALPYVLPLEESSVPHVRGMARSFRADAEGAFGDSWPWDQAVKGLDPDDEDEGSARLREILRPDDHEAFLFVVMERVALEGPQELPALLDLLGSHDAQIAFVGAIWRVDDPITISVLRAVATIAPSKTVAKAARKATMQHQSLLASRR